MHDYKIKDITVLFADIKSFARGTSGLEPGETFELLDEYYERIGPAIECYGGTVDKFIGDMIMITFNTEKLQPCHPVLAVKTALDIARAVDDWNKRVGEWKVDVKTGIDTGTGAVGLLGTSERKDFTAIGNVVNRAALLVDVAKSGIAVTKEVLDSVADMVEYEVSGTVEIKGMELDIYTVKSLKPGTTGDNNQRSLF